MRPLFLRLKGFKGIKAGLGLDEINIDFSSLSGLVAVCGPNGSGKTTIVDNMTPFNVMPFKCRKSKDYSPGSFSYYDQTFGSDAAKELVFSIGDNVYRSLILIDSVRRKMEGYLYRRTVNGVVSWEALNDGKVRTYNEAVEQLVGSPRLFFTSVFRAQGAKNLSDYSRGDVMALVGELLGVDRIREQSEKAREVAKLLGAEVTADRRRLDGLRAELSASGDLAQQQADLILEMENRGAERAEIERDLSAARQKLADAEQRQAAVAAQRDRLAIMEAAWRECDRTLRDLDHQTDQACRAKDAAHRQAQERLEEKLELIRSEDRAIRAGEQRAMDTHAARTGPLKVRIDRARKMLANADAIRAKVVEEAEKKAKAAELRQTEQALDGEVQALRVGSDRHSERLRELQEERQLLERARTARQHQWDRTHADLKRAQDAADQLDGLDCAGRGDGWVNEACSLLQEAVAAKHAVPGLRDRLEKLGVPTPEEERHTQRAEALQVETQSYDPKALQAKQEALQGVKEQLATLRTEIEAIGKWTVLLPELEHAETTLREAEEEIARADADRDAAVAGSSEQAVALVARKEAADAAWERETQEATEACRQAVAALNDRRFQVEADRAHKHREWEALADQLREAQGVDLNTLRDAVARCQEKAERLDAELLKLHGRQGALQAQQKASERQEEEARRIEEKIGRFDVEIARWKLLERACGNDGVVALEIDDSGPGISALANDLLRECFGARFSLRFETQREKLKGGTAETFDVTVFDSETGETSSITEKSGGQTVWLEGALTRAIALYNAHGSGRDFQAFFGDESDGPLDPEKKQAYMAVKRRALELGRHQVEFFVSQDEGIQAMADRRIVLGGGKVTVEA